MVYICPNIEGLHYVLTAPILLPSRLSTSHSEKLTGAHHQ